MPSEHQVHPVILKDLLDLSHPEPSWQKNPQLSRVQETWNERKLIFKIDHMYLVNLLEKLKMFPSLFPQK